MKETEFETKIKKLRQNINNYLEVKNPIHVEILKNRIKEDCKEIWGKEL